MTGLTGGPGPGGFDYAQAGQPADPAEGETWYDTDADEARVYDGAGWHTMTVGQHSELGGVTAADHHQRPTAGNALVETANAFDVDEGSIDLANLAGYPVGTGDLGFDPATQAELDAHTGDGTNPHGVTAAQAGALADAAGSVSATHLAFDPATQAELDGHAGVADAHHARPTATGAASQAAGYREKGDVGNAGNLSGEYRLWNSNVGNGADLADGATATLSLVDQVWADGFRVYITDQGDQTLEVMATFADGSTSQTFTVSTTGSFVERNFAQAGLLEAWTLTDTTADNNLITIRELQPHVVALPSHSHAI